MAPPFNIGLWGLSKIEYYPHTFQQTVSTISVKSNLVEVSPAWFVANVLMNLLMAQVLQTHCIGEWFAAGLQGEGLVNIAKGQSVTIHRAH